MFLLSRFRGAALAAPFLFLTALAQPMPEQAKRGEQLFQKGAHGVTCAFCHAMAGQGVSVGPDLRNIARVHPRGVVMGILATRTQYVIEVTLKDGKVFPAMRAGNDEYWDLSATPAVKRTVPAADVKGIRDNGKWRHPPESAQMSREEMADVIAYLRFVAMGDTKGVNAADLPQR